MTLANLAGAGLHHVRAFDVPVSTLSARAISLGADRLGDKQIQVSRVLVPLDGSELATGAIDYRVALPQANGLEHVLVEVVATIGDEKTWVEEEDRLNVAADRIRARRGRLVEREALTDGCHHGSFRRPRTSRSSVP